MNWTCCPDAAAPLRDARRRSARCTVQGTGTARHPAIRSAARSGIGAAGTMLNVPAGPRLTAASIARARSVTLRNCSVGSCPASGNAGGREQTAEKVVGSGDERRRGAKDRHPLRTERRDRERFERMP